MSKRLYLVAILCLPGVPTAGTAFGQELTESNYDRLVPQGKEVDAIYGDFALGNPTAKAVIAAPLATRQGNMTVRTISGCLIDLAAASHESDQLSAFYPGRRKFPFSKSVANEESVTITAPGTKQRPACEVTYQLLPNQPIIELTSTWTNTTDEAQTLVLEDDIRADAGNEDMVKSPNGTHDLFYVHDIFWHQAYGVRAKGFSLRCNSNARESVLTYEPADGKAPALQPGESFTFKRQVIVGRDLPTVMAIADSLSGTEVYETKIIITDSTGQPISQARLSLSSEMGDRGTIVTDAAGSADLKLPHGIYTVNATVAGTGLLPKDSVVLQIHNGTNEFQLRSGDYSFGAVAADITDGDGNPIPVKVEFIGTEKTPSPDWGPDSAEHFVQNLAYSANGKFTVPLQTGTYDVIVSHGPEYDAVFTKLTIAAGKSARLAASLDHSVRTPGWVSADFHSHSSPSGDNTGSQKGRVLNLAAENIEFAPCTEHNRVSSYSGHIQQLGLQPFLATVSGMELTGQPLLLNHQNVFPLKHQPRTQDGGGPLIDTSPETQIERLSLWDDRSEKLVQQNHPDIGWLFFDKNGDGTPDDGYARSFPFIDVMEIHLIDRILNLSQFDIRDGKAVGNNRMLNWLQLLNQGFRIYGVVNTDAHYNFHGSGWLRNWIQSSTDDPQEIGTMEMVHASEQGRLIMSNGPYLEATFQETGGTETVVSGQDLIARSGNVTVHVRVQCPNWIDIDTVFLLINGKPVDEFGYTRADDAAMFQDGPLKFDWKLKVPLKQDSHIVVVTGHRSEILGDVLGPTWGQQHPAALTNPVFVDVDGDGFEPNKDTLGFPLPVKFGSAP